MSQVSLDLSGIAAAQDGLPEPIATALSALQTGHNDTDTKLTNTTSGHNHDGSSSRQLSTAALSDYIAPVTWATPLFYKNDNSTSLSGTVRRAWYSRIGKEVTAEVYADGIGDPGGITIWMTLPIAAAYDASWTISCGFGENSNGTTAYVSYAIIGTSNGNRVAIRLGADNAWGAANNIINMKLKYFAAT